MSDQRNLIPAQRFKLIFSIHRRESLDNKQMARIVWASLLSLLFLFPITSVLADEGTADRSEDWEKRLEMLRSVPYIAFSETGVEENRNGVILYNSEKACDGYNLYCTRSTFGTAFLLDMNGQLVHRWTYSPNPESTNKHGIMNDHVIMLPNGDLVAAKKSEGLYRLNWKSKLIWKKELAAHHDVVQAHQGSFYVLAGAYEDHREMRVWFDAILHVSARGKEIGRWFTYDHLGELKRALDTRSFLDIVLDNTRASRSRIGQRYKYDYFHMNTINVIPATVSGEKDSRFQKGNLLICFRNVNQIVVLEKDTYRVLWAWGEGELEGPHHPTMLENGHILIFDNGVKRLYARVLELDPIAEAIVWEYTAEPPKDFYSPTRGSAQRLPNGNTLICESDRGRVFEMTQEGEMVWEWVNPVVAPSKVRRRQETIYRMMRLPKAQVERLLKREWSGE